MRLRIILNHLLTYLLTVTVCCNYNCLQAWTIDYWLNKAGAPKDKVIVGISTYGTTFTLANAARHGLKASSTGPGKAGKYTQEPGTLAYYEVLGDVI